MITLVDKRRFIRLARNEWVSGVGFVTSVEFDAFAATFTDHSARHENAGADEISVAGLSGDLADLQDPKDHTHQSAGSGVGGKIDHGLALNGLADDDHTQYQLESEKDAVSGYAGLNASSRTTKGVDTTDDVIVDLATKGLVLKDTQGTPHYWRVTVSTLGVLTTADLGTVKP